MTKEMRFQVAETLHADNFTLFNQYPGYWTMRMDLTLRPENYDQLDENHFFSFDTTRTDTDTALKCALNILQERLGEVKFDALVNAYLSKHVNTTKIS